MRHILTLICLSTTLLASHTVSGQYTWDYRDPNDLNIIDFGDNKVLLYNAIGLGLALLLSDKLMDGSDATSTFSLEYVAEYRKEPLSQYLAINSRRSFHIRKFLSIGGELKAFLIKDAERVIPGLGFSPFFSWNIVNKQGFRLTYDNGVGPVIFTSSFPEGGTHFNFYTYYGLETEIKLNAFPLIIGVRNTHVSNAEIKGRERNPSFDGVGFYLAFSI